MYTLLQISISLSLASSLNLTPASLAPPFLLAFSICSPPVDPLMVMAKGWRAIEQRVAQEHSGYL